MLKNNPPLMSNKQINFPSSKLGFTLVELLMGIIIIGTAILMLSTLFFSQGNRGTDMLFQVRAAELGQSVMNEIWGKRFDENTDPNGVIPCGIPSNQCSTILGSEEDNHQDWDDVDDYNGMTENTLLPIPIKDAKTYADLYPNFRLTVAVSYFDTKTQTVSKLITITVTTPNNEKIVFNALRSNF